MLVEQLDSLMDPQRVPSPCESLVRAWQDVVSALSVNGAGETALAGNAAQKAFDGLQQASDVMAQTVVELQSVSDPTLPVTPPTVEQRRVQFAPPTPQVPNPGGGASLNCAGKGKECSGEGADDVFAQFQTELGKRGPETIEDTQPKPPPLRAPTVPRQLPSMSGDYTPFFVARAPGVCTRAGPRQACN